MDNETLLDKTYRLIAESGQTSRQMAEGSGLGYHWIAKLRQRTFSDPGVNSVERLHNYLRATRPRRRAA
jgi:hypothetical protein